MRSCLSPLVVDRRAGGLEGPTSLVLFADESERPPCVRQVAVAGLELRVGAPEIVLAVLRSGRIGVGGVGWVVGVLGLDAAHVRSTTSVESGTGRPFSSKTIVPPPESVPVAPR